MVEGRGTWDLVLAGGFPPSAPDRKCDIPIACGLWSRFGISYPLIAREDELSVTQCCSILIPLVEMYISLYINPT